MLAKLKGISKRGTASKTVMAKVTSIPLQAPNLVPVGENTRGDTTCTKVQTSNLQIDTNLEETDMHITDKLNMSAENPHHHAGSSNRQRAVPSSSHDGSKLREQEAPLEKAMKRLEEHYNSFIHQTTQPLCVDEFEN